MSRLVVILVGSALILSVLMIGLLALNGQPVPDALPQTSLASLTGLLGLLAPRPGTSE